MNKLMLGLIGMFLLVLAPAYAACVTPTNGQTFTTNTDICAGTHTLSSGVIIGASNIYLNCSGATFNGVTASGNSGVTATGRQGVLVRDCRFVNYAKGVLFTRTHNSTIELFNSTNSLNNRAISFVNSSDNVIRDSNVIHDAGYGVGLETSSDRNLVENNTIASDTAGSGSFVVVMDTGSSNNIIRNNIINSKSGGNDNVITAQTNSNNNIIDHNNITILAGSGSVKYGIRMDNVVGTNITFNRIIEGASSNNLGSLQVNADRSYIADNFIRTTSTDSYGLLLTSASAGSIILRNNITTTGGGSNSPAIQLDTNSNDVLIQDNTLSVGGSNAHIRLAGITNATIQDNEFRGTNTAIDVFTASTYNLVFTFGDIRLVLENRTTDVTKLGTSRVVATDKLVAINSSADQTLNTSATLTFDNSGPFSKFRPTVFFYSPFTDNLTEVLNNGVSCPSNICTGTNYDSATGLLTVNVSHFSTYGISTCTTPTAGMYINEPTLICPGTYNFNDALIINASNNIVACNNTATFDGTDVGTGIFINTQFNNVTIDGCTFKDYVFGVEINTSSDNHTIVNNTFISNFADGIRGFSTSGNLIIGNNHTNQNFVLITGPNNGNRIIDNIAFNNVGSPTIWLTQSEDSLIEGNRVSSTDTSQLIVIQASNNMTVRNNNLGPTLSICLEANSTVSNSTYQNNNLHGCGLYGIQITATSNFLIENNTITNITSSGIRLFSTANNHLIRDNIITNAGANGIEFGGTANNNIIENNTIINGVKGITIAGAGSNVIRRNIIQNSSGDGIRQSGTASLTTIEYNNITDSGQYGILFTADGGNNVVRGNRISDVAVSDIAVSFSDDNIFENNFLGTSGDTASGVYLEDSVNTNFTNNTFATNAIGIDLVRFTNLRIINNLFENTSASIFVGSPGFGSNENLTVIGNTLRDSISGGSSAVFVDGSTTGVDILNNYIRNYFRGINIVLITGSGNIENNTIVNASTGIRVGAVSNSIFSHNRIINSSTVGVSLFLTTSNNLFNITPSEFSGNTLDFSTDDSSTNDLTINGPNTTLSFDNKVLNVSSFENNFALTHNIAGLNSSLEPLLNTSATIRMTGLIFNETPRIFELKRFTFNSQEVQDDGSLCIAPFCDNIVYSNVTGTITFDVQTFSSYSTLQPVTGAAIGDPAFIPPIGGGGAGDNIVTLPPPRTPIVSAENQTTVKPIGELEFTGGQLILFTALFLIVLAWRAKQGGK